MNYNVFNAIVYDVLWRFCGSYPSLRTNKLVQMVMTHCFPDWVLWKTEITMKGVDTQTERLKEQWQKDLDGYLAERKCLAGLVLLMDVRHPLKEFDRLILDWSAAADMPLHILLTKADKLSYGAAKNTLVQTRKALKDHPAPLSLQLFSAETGHGCDEAWDKLGEWLEIVFDVPENEA